MALSAFTQCGAGFECSDEKPLGEVIYDAAVESEGGVYQDEEFAGPVAARRFAMSMGIARARYTLERAKNQADPTEAQDLLAAHETHHQIVPEFGQTEKQRRAILAAAMRLTLGPVRDNVVYQLETALGADFVAWVTCPGADDNSFPEKPWEAVHYPGFPLKNAVGIFEPPANWKVIRLTSRVDHTNYVNQAVPLHQRVSWEHVAGDEGPLVGRRDAGYGEDGRIRLKPDKLIVEPGELGQQEVVELATGVTDTHLTANFLRTHPAGAIAMRAPWPFWLSNQKHSVVVVVNGRAKDRGVREKANAVLSRLLGETSSWGIVDENVVTGAAGPFIPGSGIPGITPLREIVL